MIKALAAFLLLLGVSLPGAAQAGGVFIAFPFPFVFPFPFFGAPYYAPPAYPPPPAYYPQPAAYQPQAAPAVTTEHPAAATAHANATKTAHNCRTFKGNAVDDGTHEPFYGTACLGSDKKWHIQQP